MKLRATFVVGATLRASVAVAVLAVQATVALAAVQPSRLRATLAPATLLAARQIIVAAPLVSAPVATIGRIDTALDFRLSFSDAVATIDSIMVERTASFADAVTVSDTARVSYGKVVSESQGVSDAASVSVGKALADTEGISETLTFNVSTNLADSQSTVDQLSVILGLNPTLEDSEGTADAITFSVAKVLADTVSTPTDAATVHVGKALADTQGVTDAIGFSLGLRVGMFEPRPPLGGATLNELVLDGSLDDSLQGTIDRITAFAVGKALSDIVGASSQITAFDINKTGLADTQATSDSFSAQVTVYEFRTLNDAPLNDKTMN